MSQDRIPGEPFVPKPAKEAEMERIMKSMEVHILLIVFNIFVSTIYTEFWSIFCVLNMLQGMPGAPGMKMYSREDLMNMNNFGNEDADDDEDEDDDGFPSNLVPTKLLIITDKFSFFSIKIFIVSLTISNSTETGQSFERERK